MFEINKFVLNSIAEDNEIVLYPYRTAQVKSALFRFDAESPEERNSLQRMEEALYKKVSKVYSPSEGIHPVDKPMMPDNHVCLVIGNMVIMFHDWSVLIGMDIEVGNW